MSLKHILNTIEVKTQEEIEKINKKAKEEEQAILNEAKETAQRIKDQIKQELEQKSEEKIVKARQQATRQIKNEILWERKKILDEIFIRAVKKITKQEDNLTNLYSKLLEELLKDKATDGKIITSFDNLALLKKLADKTKVNYPVTAEIKEDGFKFLSATIEVDNTLNRLIEEIRDEAEIEVAKMLFE